MCASQQRKCRSALSTAVVTALALAASAALPGSAAAADGGSAAPLRAGNADALAKALSNPIAALISVPFQFNYDTGYGADGDRWTLNVQPVVPITLSEDWNVISRTILPVQTQTGVVAVASDPTQSGIGDVIQSFFFSPKAPTAGGWVWGAGPVLMLPTASDDALGTEKWSAGPTAVALRQTAGGWTYGALANHLWSFAGDGDRADVNATFLQPFVSKALGRGRTVSANLESTYAWNGGGWTPSARRSARKATRRRRRST